MLDVAEFWDPHVIVPGPETMLHAVEAIPLPPSDAEPFSVIWEPEARFPPELTVGLVLSTRKVALGPAAAA
jgi:hypothetical protein